MVFVGFSTPRLWNPLSALIRTMTRSRTSHTFLVVEDPIFELRLVLEAHSTGFRLISLTRFVKDNKMLAIVVPRPDRPIECGLPAAGEWLGARFDVVGLFGIFLALLARWLVQRPWRNPFPTSSALFCSEAVIRTLKEAGYPDSSELGDETTTPGELLAWFRAKGCQVIERDALKLWRDMKPHRNATRCSLPPVAQPAPEPPSGDFPPAAA